MRGVNLTTFSFSAEVVRVDATQSVMSATKAMAAVAKTVTLFNVVAGLTTPIACLAIVLSPRMNGTISNGNSGFTPSSPGEVRGRVVVVINVTANASNGIGGGKAVRTLVHGQVFGLKGLLESSDATGNLDGFGVVGAEVLDFSHKGGVVFFGQCPIYKVSVLSPLLKEQFVFGGNGRVVVPYGSGMERTGMDGATTTVSGKEFWECGVEVVRDEGGNNILIAVGNDKEVTGACGCKVVLPAWAWEYARLRTAGTGGLSFGISVHDFYI